MKFYKLTSIILSAAMCALSLSGCSQKSETPLESSDANSISSVLESVPTSTAESSKPLNGTSSESVSNGGLTSEANSGAEASSSLTETSSSVPEQNSSQPETDSSSTHTHTYVSKTVAPTCVEPGYTVHTCSCGKQYTSDTVDAPGHDCTENVVQPACTASGYTQYTCKRCGYTYKDDYTNALGHKYSSQTIKPTCTQNGYTLNTCERCGSGYRSDQKQRLGHSWGEWTTTKEPTTSSEGEQRRECSRCGEISTKAIPRAEANPADYADEVIRLVNIERANNGLPPLSKRNDLTEYAQLRSTEIVSNFAHERPDGSSPLKYVISLNGVRTAGENIAAGQKTPEKVVSGWMNSPGHRANILNSNYTSIGVGCYRDSNSYYGVYWTQIFAG